MKTSPDPPAAFTLIELLTVIAIIGILAAILIPVVATVRHSGRSAQSVSNLRQIGVAVNIYTSEHDGRFPFLNRNRSNIDSSDNYFWMESLEVIALGWNRREMEPAGQPHPRHEIFRDPTVREGDSHRLSDYGANPLIMTDANPDNPGRAESETREAAMRQPSRTVVVATARHSSGASSWYIQGAFANGGDADNVPDGRLNSNQIGAVFADGHVELIAAGPIFNDRVARRAFFHPDY